MVFDLFVLRVPMQMSVGNNYSLVGFGLQLIKWVKYLEHDGSMSLIVVGLVDMLTDETVEVDEPAVDEGEEVLFVGDKDALFTARSELIVIACCDEKCEEASTGINLLEADHIAVLVENV